MDALIGANAYAEGGGGDEGVFNVENSHIGYYTSHHHQAKGTHGRERALKPTL